MQAQGSARVGPGRVWGKQVDWLSGSVVTSGGGLSWSLFCAQARVVCCVMCLAVT